MPDNEQDFEKWWESIGRGLCDDKESAKEGFLQGRKLPPNFWK